MAKRFSRLLVLWLFTRMEKNIAETKCVWEP